MDGYVSDTPLTTAGKISGPLMLRRSMRERRRGPAALSPYLTPSYFKRFVHRPVQVHDGPPVDLGADHDSLGSVVQPVVDQPVVAQPVVERVVETVVDVPVKPVVDVPVKMVTDVPVKPVVLVERGKKLKRRARKKNDDDDGDEIPEDTLMEMIAICVDETGFLTTPPDAPPGSIEGPSTVRELCSSGGTVRCMFVRPNRTYMCLEKEFWGRLSGEFDQGYLDNCVS